MQNLLPQMEPFDEPSKPPRRSSRLAKDKDAEPLLSLRRQNLDQNNSFTQEDKDWDFMDKMEFLDPWNPKEDPWAIRSIKGHRDSEKHKGRKELLVVYQSDGEEEWLPYEKVLADEPWLVAQYVNSQKLQFKHGGKK